MKKYINLLGGMLIAMFFVAFNAGCDQNVLAKTVGPSEVVLNPTAVPTVGVTPGVTPTTNNWYVTVQGASAATFTFCSYAWDGISSLGTCSGSASLIGPGYLMTGSTSAVPQTWNFYLYMVNTSSTETWTVSIYKNGVWQGNITPTPGGIISQSF